MKKWIFSIVVISLVSLSANGSAGPAFTGSWEIDLRTPEQISANAECGHAGFELTQQGNVITGSHYFYTVDCGRMNEGGAVHGVAIGSRAVLYVKSGRNAGVVMGEAYLKDRKLHWKTVEELEPGLIEGDNLILSDAVLIRKEPSK